MYDIAILTVLVILLVFIVYKRNNAEGFETVDLPDRDRAEQTLAALNNKLIKFFEFLKIKFKINVPDDFNDGMPRPDYVRLPKIRGIVGRMIYNYNPDFTRENDPRNTSETSVTVDKQRMKLCIRDRVTHKILPLDQLTFVLLHEAAHCGNKTWGHDQDFWETFKFVLHEANLGGFYKPIDYSKNPFHYCGMDVTYQPLYDVALRDIWKEGPNSSD